MLRFFSKIRYKLATENKLGKYLRYAIGEIVLVVIGILIALQVNNWNNQRKIRNEEILILKEIKKNLEDDLDDFVNNLAHMKNIQISTKHLLESIESDSEYQDSLSFYLFYVGIFPHFQINISGYELLKSKGLEIISNDSLRKAISNLYEVSYTYILTLENERISYNLNYIDPIKNKYLGIESMSKESQPKEFEETSWLKSSISVGGIRKIINYDALKKNVELKSILREVQFNAAIIQKKHLTVRIDINDLINQIDFVVEELN